MLRPDGIGPLLAAGGVQACLCRARAGRTEVEFTAGFVRANLGGGLPRI